MNQNEFPFFLAYLVFTIVQLETQKWIKTDTDHDGSQNNGFWKILCPNSHNLTDDRLQLQTLLSEQEWTNLETKSHTEVIIVDVRMNIFSKSWKMSNSLLAGLEMRDKKWDRHYNGCKKQYLHPAIYFFSNFIFRSQGKRNNLPEQG